MASEGRENHVAAFFENWDWGNQGEGSKLRGERQKAENKKDGSEITFKIKTFNDTYQSERKKPEKTDKVFREKLAASRNRARYFFTCKCGDQDSQRFRNCLDQGRRRLYPRKPELRGKLQFKTCG
jgi:hypothetical protein